ncbi:dienelactone hydrolase family protein [Streptomyces griseofuscus]|uniref:dienelactone hydrolase family protein n=1 Tax=Streptomyces griseofuscus TaxID=146922 RepID=UPI0034161078
MSAPQARQNTHFVRNGKEIHAYLALPASGRGPGVILVQEWWGLTDHIADVADRLAEAGFVALAPDLFGGRTTHDSDEAGKMMSDLPLEQGVADLVGAVDWLLEHEAVKGDALGTVGFCMGGGFVLALAAAAGEKIAAAVPFYGVFAGEDPDFSGMKAAVLGHFGEKDTYAPPERAQDLARQIRGQSGAPVELQFYPAGHAFHNDENLLGTYDETQAQLAWKRTLTFLTEQLTVPATA